VQWRGGGRAARPRAGPPTLNIEFFKTRTYFTKQPTNFPDFDHSYVFSLRRRENKPLGFSNNQQILLFTKRFLEIKNPAEHGALK